MTASTDRIEKRLVLHAPLARVFRALTNAREFGEWFRVDLADEFREGATLRGSITHPGYEHLTMELFIERIEPERYFAFRWHPYAVDPKHDYSSELTTLVEFTLTQHSTGTELVIVESGFDKIPAARRAEAFRMNNDGWQAQCENLKSYVAAR